jgi:vacuolar-type H+-ATPase subunit I/STV1
MSLFLSDHDPSTASSSQSSSISQASVAVALDRITIIENLQDLLDHKKTEKDNLEKRVKDLETAQSNKTTELEIKATELETMRETV